MIAALMAGLLVAWLQATPSATAAAGSISGIVINDVGVPVRHALVKLSAPVLAVPVSVLSDDEGRFRFDALQSGAYTLSASKAAHVESVYGALRRGGRGASIVLRDGESRTELRVSLPRGAAITGVVRDATGEPVPGVNVLALSLVAPGAPPQVAPARTDDRGTYRIFGLPPDTYVVVAAPDSVGVGPLSRLSVDEMDEALAALSRRLPSGASPARALRDAPTYYPGTARASQAAQLTLAAGDEHAGVDIVLQIVPTGSITGRLIRPQESLKTGFTFSIVDDARIPTVSGSNAGPVFQPDGTFRIDGLGPGTYTIRSSTLDGRAWVRASVTINGDDVAGIELSMRPTTTISGRIVVDPQSTTPPPDLRTARVVCQPTGQAPPSLATTAPDDGATDTQSFREAPDADGAFVRRLVPGRYRLSMALASRWWARSAMLNGRDLLDDEVDIGESDVTDLTIMITDRHSELTGRLVHDEDQPVTHYSIVVFPAERSFWRPGRRVRSTPLRADGRFSIRDLPGGEYLLAAVTDYDAADYVEAAAFEPLAAQAITVIVRDGETTVQNIRIK